MQFAILSIAVLFTNPDAAQEQEQVENLSEILLMNCIDTEFKILVDDASLVVVACEGDWKPWQSRGTRYDVQRELRKAGIVAKPFTSVGGLKSNPIWRSGVDEFPILRNGKASTFNSQIQGMSTKGKTFVILFKRKA